MNHGPVPLIETEVKFHVSDLPGLQARLLGIGANSFGRELELNIRFNDDGRNRLQPDALLRLRRARKATLTYKSVPPDADPAFKQLTELEVEVDDFDTMLRILTCLDFRPVQAYEKWRETLVLDQTSFCLDTLPFGDFLEIEGSKNAIVGFAERLGFPWSRRILMNYLEMFDLVRRRHNLPFHDATFANFNGASIELGAMLPLMEARAR